MELNIIQEIVAEQLQLFNKKPSGTIRIVDTEKCLKLPHIVVITGIRHCGKSTLLKQFAQKYETYYYVNFDDERFIDFTVADFQNLMLVFKKMFQATTIFIDEIQNIKGWERFVRRLYDEGYKIFITGSNAHLLSSDLATHLTGRYIKIELFPFSFKEFLAFHSKAVYEIYNTDQKAEILQLFDNFLQTGGMPEFIKFNEKEVLQRVYEDVIYKDLIVRFGIRNINDFKRLSQYVFTNFTRNISYNSLAETLNINSTTTISEYISYLCEAYLVFEVFKYNASLKKQFTTDKKFFVIDNGIRSAVAFLFSSDLGKLLENLVFLELRRRYEQVWYYKTNNKLEVDFVYKKDHQLHLVQVAYSITDAKTLNRQTTALEKAMQEIKITNGLILTYSEDREIITETYTISIKPVWKYLLSEN